MKYLICLLCICSHYAFPSGDCEGTLVRFVQVQPAAYIQPGEVWRTEMPFQRDKGSNVIYYTGLGNSSDLELVLNFLKPRIGDELALKRTRSISYLEDFNYENFLQRVALYERYIGEEGVHLRLQKSLVGFHKGEVEEIERVIQFIEGYIGTEGVREIMGADLLGFSRVQLSELKEMVDFIEGYIGKEGVQERMRAELRSFSRVQLSKLREVVKFIEGYIDTEGVQERMRLDLRSFSGVQLFKLKKIIERSEGLKFYFAPKTVRGWIESLLDGKDVRF